MLACAYTIPDGIKYDLSVMGLHPNAGGIQHDEVKSGFGTIANFLGITWTPGKRDLPKIPGTETSKATMHRSVYERFDMDAAPDYDAMRLYRPLTLEIHLDFKDAYGKAGAKSNPDRPEAAAYIEDYLPPNL